MLFKYEGEQWKRINLAELPTVLLGAGANVIVGTPDIRVVKSFYTAAGVNAVNHDIQAPEARSILRDALPNVRKSCPAMIPYGKNGGWIGLDWFTDQPSLDACLSFCNQKKVSPETCPCNSIFKWN